MKRHIFNKRKPSNTHALSLKQRLTGKVFQILKKTLDGQRVPTQFENKIAIRNKWNSEKLEVRAPETKKQARKRNVVFRDTIPALSVDQKRSFKGKAESHTEPTKTLNFAIFLKNHLLFRTRKEHDHGKDVKDRHTVLHRYRCAACHFLQFFTKNNLVRNPKH